MSRDASIALIGVIMGLSGTVAMDIWAMFLRGVFKQPLPNWGAVGRWAAHLPTLFHADIGAVPAAKHETAIGWAVHYGVGIIYGVIFAVWAGPTWLVQPDFLPLWTFGLVTIAAGWFLLHPGLGLGWALSKTPNPTKGRVMGLVAHTVFALGMWAPIVFLNFGV